MAVNSSAVQSVEWCNPSTNCYGFCCSIAIIASGDGRPMVQWSNGVCVCVRACVCVLASVGVTVNSLNLLCSPFSPCTDMDCHRKDAVDDLGSHENAYNRPDCLEPKTSGGGIHLNLAASTAAFEQLRSLADDEEPCNSVISSGCTTPVLVDSQRGSMLGIDDPMGRRRSTSDASSVASLLRSNSASGARPPSLGGGGRSEAHARPSMAASFLSLMPRRDSTISDMSFLTTAETEIYSRSTHSHAGESLYDSLVPSTPQSPSTGESSSHHQTSPTPSTVTCATTAAQEARQKRLSEPTHHDSLEENNLYTMTKAELEAVSATIPESESFAIVFSRREADEASMMNVSLAYEDVQDVKANSAIEQQQQPKPAQQQTQEQTSPSHDYKNILLPDFEHKFARVDGQSLRRSIKKKTSSCATREHKVRPSHARPRLEDQHHLTEADHVEHSASSHHHKRGSVPNADELPLEARNNNGSRRESNLKPGMLPGRSRTQERDLPELPVSCNLSRGSRSLRSNLPPPRAGHKASPRPKATATKSSGATVKRRPTELVPSFDRSAAGGGGSGSSPTSPKTRRSFRDPLPRPAYGHTRATSHDAATCRDVRKYNSTGIIPALSTRQPRAALDEPPLSPGAMATAAAATHNTYAAPMTELAESMKICLPDRYCDSVGKNSFTSNSSFHLADRELSPSQGSGVERKLSTPIDFLRKSLISLVGQWRGDEEPMDTLDSPTDDGLQLQRYQQQQQRHHLAHPQQQQKQQQPSPAEQNVKQALKALESQHSLEDDLAQIESNDLWDFDDDGATSSDDDAARRYAASARARARRKSGESATSHTGTTSTMTSEDLKVASSGITMTPKPGSYHSSMFGTGTIDLDQAIPEDSIFDADDAEWVVDR